MNDGNLSVDDITSEFAQATHASGPLKILKYVGISQTLYYSPTDLPDLEGSDRVGANQSNMPMIPKPDETSRLDDLPKPENDVAVDTNNVKPSDNPHQTIIEPTPENRNNKNFLMAAVIILAFLILVVIYFLAPSPSNSEKENSGPKNAGQKTDTTLKSIQPNQEPDNKETNKDKTNSEENKITNGKESFLPSGDITETNILKENEGKNTLDEKIESVISTKGNNIETPDNGGSAQLSGETATNKNPDRNEIPETLSSNDEIKVENKIEKIEGSITTTNTTPENLNSPQQVTGSQKEGNSEPAEKTEQASGNPPIEIKDTDETLKSNENNRTYTVEPNDNMTKISRKFYNSDRYVGKLCNKNKLSPSECDNLEVGMVIKLLSEQELDT